MTLIYWLIVIFSPYPTKIIVQRGHKLCATHANRWVQFMLNPLLVSPYSRNHFWSAFLIIVTGHPRISCGDILSSSKCSSFCYSYDSIQSSLKSDPTKFIVLWEHKLCATPSSSGLWPAHDHISRYWLYLRILMNNKVTTFAVTVKLGWPAKGEHPRRTATFDYLSPIIVAVL